MSFWDSVSSALGTDGGNSGLLPSVSNALGTDGSKNGLLNDPLSMAAVAAAAAVATGGISLAGTAGAGSELAAWDAAGAATAAEATAGAAGSWVPSWMSLDTALSAAKIAAPVLVSNATNKQNLNAAKDLLTLQRQTAQAQGMPFTTAASKTITGNTPGNTNYMAWGLLAVAGVLAYQHFGK